MCSYQYCNHLKWIEIWQAKEWEWGDVFGKKRRGNKDSGTGKHAQGIKMWKVKKEISGAICATNEHAILTKAPWSKEHDYALTHCFFVWSLLATDASHRNGETMQLNEYWFILWLLWISSPFVARLKRKEGGRNQDNRVWKKNGEKIPVLTSFQSHRGRN